MRKINGFPVQTIAIEVFSIILGIFLALGANQWRENLNNHKRADKMLQSIVVEMQANQKLLEIVHKNNNQFWEEINSGSDSSVFKPGLQLQDYSWQSAVNLGGFEYLPYELVLEITKLYSMIDLYKNFSNQLISSHLNMAAYSSALARKVNGDSHLENYLDYFNLTIQMEEALLETFPIVIEMCEKN